MLAVKTTGISAFLLNVHAMYVKQRCTSGQENKNWNMEQICNTPFQNLVVNSLGCYLHTSTFWPFLLFCCHYCFSRFWASVDPPLAGSRFTCPICLSSSVCFFCTWSPCLSKFVSFTEIPISHLISCSGILHSQYPNFSSIVFLPLFTHMWEDEASLWIILLLPFWLCCFCQS